VEEGWSRRRHAPRRRRAWRAGGARAGLPPRRLPRTAEQAAAFLDGQPARLDAAIDLDLPVDEARRRLLARGRTDDDPAVIDHRLALDAAEAAPLLELLDRAGLLRRIDGFGTEDEVFARILEALGRR
jgi:adenylate kinase